MKITKDDIKIRFNEYNQKYFNNILQPCKYHIIRNSKSTFGIYVPAFKTDKIIGHIWIANNVDWTEEDLREIIIHEMIHHYVQTIEGHSGGLLGHNWRFKRQCRRLKKEYGLNIHKYLNHIHFIREQEKPNFIKKLYRFLFC